MPATKESLNSCTNACEGGAVSRLGIIAGGGTLPSNLVRVCLEKGVEPFVIALKGQTDPETVEGCAHIWGRMGAAGHIIKTLKKRNIKDLVLIGSIRRPSFFELKPDLKTASFFSRIGLRALGDNDLLRAVKAELKREGFAVHGVQKFIDNILAPIGCIGSLEPSFDDAVDIDRGIEICQSIGGLDVGQSVIVQDGIVLGVEAIEGTDELIKRCAHYKRGGRGGILVKLCKQQQDKDLDLPTIGPQTIENAAQYGLRGVVIHAENSILIEPQKVAEIADMNKIFVIAKKV